MNIMFVGLSGFPYLGRACDSRLTNIVNILAEENEVEIINRYSSLKKKTLEGLGLSDNVHLHEMIKRRMTGRKISFILLVLSVFVEFSFLINRRRKGKIHYLHLYSGHYVDFLFYFVVSRLIGAKVVYEYVEYRLGKNYGNNLYHKVNNFLVDKYGARLWDSCFAISNFLIRRANEVNPCLPIIKVTPLCDFSYFDDCNDTIDIEENYVMFCGSAAYFDIVKLIIDSYNQSRIHKEMKLLLVLSGSDIQLERICQYSDNCIIKSKVSYPKLIAYYKRAFALLIPLRDTVEDIARFPNKICEYSAAKGLIVTTKFGEIPYYFEDGVNAVVAEDFGVLELSNKLNKIIDGSYSLQQIKSNCYKTGKESFDIFVYKDRLTRFLKEKL